VSPENVSPNISGTEPPDAAVSAVEGSHAA
jgi:hypothetical protein